MRRLAGAVLGLVGAAAAAAGPRSVRELVEMATVRLASGCSGAVAERADVIVTALHCVDDRTSVRVRFANGVERTAHVAATDTVADQAVLLLPEPAPTGVTPLRIATRRQIPGTVLYYYGHPDRVAFQTARLDRIGQCPSLPSLQNALFTSIAGKPGDSGAPLVNAEGQIVGLVHGGAACRIATPASTLLALVARTGG
ncbi:MAG TPA: serine protease [Candidatus Limnocylindria bacterium]|nr:serine protease [Candidatus Limnocylindria bacterium]